MKLITIREAAQNRADRSALAAEVVSAEATDRA
jgi:hypothetical protein